MANPGFSQEDGSGMLIWETLPDGGSTNWIEETDRRRFELRGQDAKGRHVFNFVLSTKRTWSFVMSGISTTFFDSLQAFAALRRFFYYPDSANLLNEFRVRIVQPRLEAVHQSGKIYTRMDLEVF